jgi:hypothetical protein
MGIFLFLLLLCISEQLAGGPSLNFCTAYHCTVTMILRDQVNIRPIVDCIRAALTVSI